ncbi:MAG: LON peptidase substrate-binding domain-containing protein [Planctomycetia bacterium]|jgi:Lon protease-like protein|nr:LON peptidase substrate-binding domain-containing protein [Planctomycetia bacterium]
MADEPLAFSPDQFSGLARVFPLPNLVMFPHVMQALHVYEPRYRAMLEEAIEDDRLIALGVLAPGWEQQYEGRPTLRSTACLCRVATHQRTPEGTYNVLLLGVRRLRLIRELPPKKLFRVVESEIVDDELAGDVPAEAAATLQKQLLAAFKRAMPKIPDAYEQLDQLLGSQITLGMLADIVAYTIDLDLEWKMRLLAESDVLKRTALLLEAISARPAAGSARRFPPEFSVN